MKENKVLNNGDLIAELKRRKESFKLVIDNPYVFLQYIQNYIPVIRGNEMELVSLETDAITRISKNDYNNYILAMEEERDEIQKH